MKVSLDKTTVTLEFMTEQEMNDFLVGYPNIKMCLDKQFNVYSTKPKTLDFVLENEDHAIREFIWWQAGCN